MDLIRRERARQEEEQRAQAAAVAEQERQHRIAQQREQEARLEEERKKQEEVERAKRLEDERKALQEERDRLEKMRKERTEREAREKERLKMLEQQKAMMNNPTNSSPAPSSESAASAAPAQPPAPSSPKSPFAMFHMKLEKEREELEKFDKDILQQQAARRAESSAEVPEWQRRAEQVRAPQQYSTLYEILTYLVDAVGTAERCQATGRWVARSGSFCRGTARSSGPKGIASNEGCTCHDSVFRATKSGSCSRSPAETRCSVIDNDPASSSSFTSTHLSIAGVEPG
jgi:hypothetical protein